MQHKRWHSALGVLAPRVFLGALAHKGERTGTSKPDASDAVGRHSGAMKRKALEAFMQQTQGLGLAAGTGEPACAGFPSDVGAWPLAQGCQTPRPTRPPAAASDEDFVALLQRYRCGGGLARLAEVVGRAVLRRGGAAPLQTRSRDLAQDLALALVQGRALGWSWRGELWLPLAQFRAEDMALKPAYAGVLAELGAVLEELELAYWFIQPHAALRERPPLLILEQDANAVLAAARADRFLRAS